MTFGKVSIKFSDYTQTHKNIKAKIYRRKLHEDLSISKHKQMKKFFTEEKNFSYICKMQSIPFHIAYLLTRHECVIVPGLGAFVIIPSDRETTSRWSILSPPENFLEFNPEIKYDDGLLANSIAKEKKNSFKEANLLIADYVSHILHSLDKGEKVQIPWVGCLFVKDNKKIFQPERTLSCNAFNYGLTGISLSSLLLHQF
jgi:hypothetical protein